MPDTERDTPALIASYANNATGLITGQTHRDFVVTALGGYGSIRVVDGAAAQVLGTSFAKLTACTANGPAASSVTPAHGSDEITAALAGVYEVSFHASYVAPAGRTVTFRLGVEDLEQPIGCQSGGGTEPQHVNFADIVSLVAGQRVSVRAKADQAATSVTVRDASLRIKRIG